MPGGPRLDFRGSTTQLKPFVVALACTEVGDATTGISTQPQNKLDFSLTAVPVPEPETAALMPAGPGALGLLVRRRRV